MQKQKNCQTSTTGILARSESELKEGKTNPSNPEAFHVLSFYFHYKSNAYYKITTLPVLGLNASQEKKTRENAYSPAHQESATAGCGWICPYLLNNYH